MKFSEFRQVVFDNADQAIQIMLPNGDFVPEHFHLTEVGRVHKQFIDCGGTGRDRTTCVLQVWVAHDTEHRLKTTKLAKILNVAGSFIEDDLDVEIEYETNAVSQYPLADVEVTPCGLLFVTGSKHTECLAPDKCGVGCR